MMLTPICMFASLQQRLQLLLKVLQHLSMAILCYSKLRDPVLWLMYEFYLKLEPCLFHSRACKTQHCTYPAVH